MKTLTLYNELRDNRINAELNSLFDYGFNKDYSRLVIDIKFNRKYSPDEMLFISEIIRKNDLKSSLSTIVRDNIEIASLTIEDKKSVLIEQESIIYDNNEVDAISWIKFQNLRN